jgi:tetraacyldisaccharide 4'-kinase
MLSHIEPLLLRAWMHRGAVSYFLWPLCVLFMLLLMLRRTLYALKIYPSQRVHALVIVVGNVVAGGAGKTPTVINIVQHLQARGLRCGVVSRGYGSQRKHVAEVFATSSASMVGDEPLLIQRKTGVPVFVAASRSAAAQQLLALYPKTQVIVCDDGLQHYSLYRDIEVCVFDNRGCGNGWCLPAGPLREPWPLRRIASIGQAPNNLLVLHTGSHPAFAGFTAQRQLAKVVTRQQGNEMPIAEWLLQNPKPILAVAGIAQPERFFAMLRDQGIPLQQTLALPDHATFEDFDTHWAQSFQIVCTEKDAVKLWSKVPDALAIALEQTVQPEFLLALDTCIDQYHGSLSPTLE